MNVFLNGEMMPIGQARVSVLDRGFTFGDGVYEYIPVYSRRPFRLAEHISRLKASLAAVELADPHDDARWGEIIRKVIAANPWEDQGVYLQVTRGAAPREHAFPAGVKPTVFVSAGALSTPPREQIDKGVAAITHEDFRWLRCDIKSISLLASCMLKNLAVKHGCAEAILLRDGFLTEAAASNVMIVSGGTVLAPPKSHLVLPGITYDVVIELMEGSGVRHAVRPVTEAELRAADEIWLTSSSKEVLPVTTLDKQPVGRGDAAGRPGPLFRRVHALYQEYKATVMRSPAHV
ncbi:MAG: D-amino acid aminotransferase [Betaproteobacteria bacterium RIFCSPLOWO2_02_FULL_62_17]|nr:MAG: D-amino acid aminotransferase [Betaproteobacteria bacterium RIFCSPLOWO2_02_FULL_62_17]